MAKIFYFILIACVLLLTGGMSSASPTFPWEGFIPSIPTVPSTDGGSPTTPSAASPAAPAAPAA